MKRKSKKGVDTKTYRTKSTCDDNTILFHEYTGHTVTNEGGTQRVVMKYEGKSPDTENVLNQARKANISLVDPIFVNPSSLEAIVIILRAIGKHAGIHKYCNGKGKREWTIVRCDGLPQHIIRISYS